MARWPSLRFEESQFAYSFFPCDLMVLENRRSKYVDCCSAAAASCNGLSDEIHLDTDCN